MEKKYFILLILAFLAVFSSCSDDDTWEEKESLRISKVYKGENLELTLSDTIPFTKGRVLLVANEKGIADISLLYVMPVEDSIVFSNVKLVNFGNKEEGYSFSAQVSDDDRTITIEGKVIDSKMIVNVVPTLHNTLAFSKWKVGSSFLKFDIEPIEKGARMNMHGFLGRQDVPITGGGILSFSGYTAFIVNMAIQLADAQLELNSNGTLALDWAGSTSTEGITVIPSGSLPVGYVNYAMKGENFYMTLPVDDLAESLLTGDLIGSLISGGSEISLSEESLSAIYKLLQGAYRGLPMQYSITEKTLGATGKNPRIEYTLSLRVTKEMILPVLDVLLPLLKPALANVNWEDINSQVPLPGIDLGLNAESIDGFLGEFVRVLNESPKFDIVLTMKREVSLAK